MMDSSIQFYETHTVHILQSTHQLTNAPNKVIDDKCESPTCCSTGAPSSGSLLEQRNIQAQHADLGVDCPH
jgi:hypothetical protein